MSIHFSHLPNCQRSFDGDKCRTAVPLPQLVLHDSPVPDSGPWWARPVGLEISDQGFLGVCLAIVWSIGKLGRTLSILVELLALGVAVLVIL